MSVRRYTTAELLTLRASPLVAKPDDLPSIEQWLEFVYLESSDGVREKLRIPHSESSANTGAPTKENKRRANAAAAPEASPMGAFSTGRPMLGTRGSALSRAVGDDISLGPPKTVFASSRHNSRISDNPSSTTTDATPAEDIETARARFFSERQANRRSGIAEKEGKDNRDSWSRAADRSRALGGDDEGKAEGSRYSRHDTADGERRNGFGDKGDPRWSSNRGEERRQNGDRPTGGWREREQARRNNGGGGHEEREPEWMMQDDPVVKKDQELGLPEAKNAAEFQMWKERMSKKTKGEPAEKEEEVVVEAPPPPEPKPSLKLDGFEGGMFGGLQPTPGSATPPVPTKTAGKGKTSRFASMFKPAAEEPPPPPPESDVQKAANGFAQTTAEDQEGFNRVLQMLGGGLKIGGQPTPPSETPSAPQSPPQPARGGANGKPKSRFFTAQPKSPEMVQSPQPGGVSLGGGPPQEPEASNMFNALREQQPRPSSGRVSELAMFDPPRRDASPDVNIQNLLAQQRRTVQTSQEGLNLLNLLKKSDVAQQQGVRSGSHEMMGGGGRPQQQQQHHPLQAVEGGDHAQLQRWLDHQHQANSGSVSETFAPRPARLSQQAPGMFEERLMQGFPDLESRRTQQRVPPPGFYDEREIMMQQQQLLQQQQQMRRGYAEVPIQQQQVRRQQTLPQQYQGEYHIASPTNGGAGPPGFNQHMPRHPPGFVNAPTQHYQREGLPPGFGPPPQSAPPGFYNAPPPPPGFQNGGMGGRGRGYDVYGEMGRR